MPLVPQEAKAIDSPGSSKVATENEYVIMGVGEAGPNGRVMRVSVRP